MSDSSDELRAAYLEVQKAQERLDADREKVREKMLASEPTWGPCLQCGHTWRSRNIRRRIGKPPRKCPKCNSAYWFDPDYTPRVPVQSGNAAGAESNGGKGQDTPASGGTAPAAPAPGPFEMAPPPRFDDTLDLMKKARKDE